MLIPLASKALTRGHYRLVEGERYSIVRMEAYLRALAALPRGRGTGFKVTPKGARSGGGSPVARALRVPIAIACLTLLAVGYQTCAQLFDLPGRLHPGRGRPSPTLWALVNIGLIAYTVAWARSVQHRRRSHRFPVAVHAAYSPDEGELPSLAGRIEDLSRHGARLSVADRARPPASACAWCCCSTTARWSCSAPSPPSRRLAAAARATWSASTSTTSTRRSSTRSWRGASATRSARTTPSVRHRRRPPRAHPGGGRA